MGHFSSSTPALGITVLSLEIFKDLFRNMVMLVLNDSIILLLLLLKITNKNITICRK